MRRHRPDSAGTIGASHAGREYSLRKLAGEQSGRRRAVLTEELGRNAWLYASVMAKHLGLRRALVTFAESLRFGWPHPRWWYGAAKAATRACLRRLLAVGLRERRSGGFPDSVETRRERGGKQLRAGDR
jgi:hypothetical protein